MSLTKRPEYEFIPENSLIGGDELLASIIDDLYKVTKLLNDLDYGFNDPAILAWCNVAKACHPIILEAAGELYRLKCEKK